MGALARAGESVRAAPVSVAAARTPTPTALTVSERNPRRPRVDGADTCASWIDCRASVGEVRPATASAVLRHRADYVTWTATGSTAFWAMPWMLKKGRRGCLCPLTSVARDPITCRPGVACQVKCHGVQENGDTGSSSTASLKVRKPAVLPCTLVIGP